MYNAPFNLVNVNLGLSNLVVNPGQLTAGEAATVSWMGRNLTGAALLGNWIDAVYLSADDRWDINDVLLATVPHMGGLAQDQSYSASANVLIPGTLPGSYRILVRGDVSNQERETDEADNLLASAPLALVIPTLPTSRLPLRGTLTTADRADYYAIPVAHGDNVGLILDGLAASGINELYASLGAIPTRPTYDFRAVKDERHLDRQDLNLAFTARAGGTIYVLVYGEDFVSPAQYDISALKGPIVLTSLTPGRHGNRTPATIVLTGAGFDDETTVEFIGPDGKARTPTETRVLSDFTLTLKLDLPTWLVGTYTVRATKPAGTDQLVNAFVVTQGGTAQLRTNLVVPSTVAFNPLSPQTIWIEYRNAGDAPMPAPLLQVDANQGAKLSADRALVFPFRGFGSLPPSVTNKVQVLGLGSTATPHILQPGESGRIPVYYLGRAIHGDLRVTFNLGTLTANDTRAIDWASQDGRIRLPGLDDAEWSRVFEIIRESVGETWGSYVVALGAAVEQVSSATGEPQTVQEAWQTIAAQAAFGEPARLEPFRAFANVGDYGPWVPLPLFHVGRARYGIRAWPLGIPTPGSPRPFQTQIFGQVRYVDCNGMQRIDNFIDAITINTADSIGVVEVRFKGFPLPTFVQGYQRFLGSGDCERDNDGTPNWPPRQGNQANSTTVNSFDPNDKLAPTGYGSLSFVQANGSLAYQVRFENKSDATGPAQKIVITDILDPNLDLDTFELTEIVFANQILTIPVGLNHYEATVPMRVNDTDILVEVTAALDRASRTLTLTLRAIDPATGWFPEDPLTGLLYPNDATGRGEGSISYRIQPVSGLPTGTRIDNRARIYFDFNDPIDTPLVFNTLDAAPPTSNVLSLPPMLDGTELTVQWTGQDDANGSGIASYDLYVSIDGGEFLPLVTGITTTSATFTVERGRRYAFYTIARDNVGHVEAAPAVPDTEIFIVAPPALIESVTINNGAAQRSRVTSITVAFTDLIEFDPGAFTLVHEDGSEVQLGVATSVVGGKTVVVLTFLGPDIVAGSLADGTYTLAINGERIRRMSDGAAGGNYTDRFFRLYGDQDGDADVDYLDFFGFSGTYGKVRGDEGFLDYFDIDADDDVDDDDLAQFLARLWAEPASVP